MNLGASKELAVCSVADDRFELDQHVCRGGRLEVGQKRCSNHDVPGLAERVPKRALSASLSFWIGGGHGSSFGA